MTGKYYIDWKHITTQRVKLVGKPGARHYEADGRIVLFSGQEQRRAQAWLDTRVAIDKNRKKGHASNSEIVRIMRGGKRK